MRFVKRGVFGKRPVRHAHVEVKVAQHPIPVGVCGHLALRVFQQLLRPVSLLLENVQSSQSAIRFWVGGRDFYGVEKPLFGIGQSLEPDVISAQRHDRRHRLWVELHCFLVAYFGGRELQIFDLDSGKELLKIPDLKNYRADSLQLSADGSAVSLVTAPLAGQLYWLATEWRATVGVNKALTAGQLDVRLFRTYPLMGCYLLTSATFSDLIPIDNFGTPGWMDHVENLKKRRFDGIYEAAAGLIDKSPWEIEGLPKERADVILTGTLIYEAVMEGFEFAELRASTRGLRFAALMDDR